MKDSTVMKDKHKEMEREKHAIERDRNRRREGNIQMDCVLSLTEIERNKNGKRVGGEDV